MSEQTDIILADNFSLPAADYANQGNSITGVRGSGKTYTAMKAAEQLMLCDIPILAFDPTGVWQNLRFGTNGQPGFPVVVAGGLSGDIELTEDNAVSIVEAARMENINLVIDLQGVATSNKSQWLRIVSDCIEFLNGNNKRFGLLHVFIEEAAEFVPQRVMPGGTLAYSRLESMARLGRNFGLGYTLINQRPEEISKAVYELSELVLVHRQPGKNSLTSVKDWLKVRGQGDSDIVTTLPKLSAGQCWAIDQNAEVLIQVLPKQTFHPNPKAGQNTAPGYNKISVDDFIGRMTKLISALQAPAANHAAAPGKTVVAAPDLMLERLMQLEGRVLDLEKKLNKPTILQPATLPAKKEQLPAPTPVKPEPEATGTTSSLASGALRMLKVALMYDGQLISKQRLATLAALSITSGSFSSYLATLAKEKYITQIGKDYTITTRGKKIAGKPLYPVPTKPEERIKMWINVLGSSNGAGRMLWALAEVFPKAMTKEQLAKRTNLSGTSGSFSQYISTLKKNGLATVIGKQVKAAIELFE